MICGNDYISDAELQKIIQTNCQENTLGGLCREILKLYSRKNSICDQIYCDFTLRNNLIAELYLQILSYFSTKTSNFLHSVAEFLKETQFQDATARKLTYSSRISAQKSINNLHYFDYYESIQFIPAVTSDKFKESVPYHADGHTVGSNPYIIKNTPLYEYIYSHILITSDIKATDSSQKFNDQFYEALKNSPSKAQKDPSYDYRFQFQNNGRFFTSVLMRLIQNCNPPYTQGYLSTNPLPAINTVFDKLVSAYKQPELKQGFESLLFLYSSENIFQFSFLQDLYSLWNDIFSKMRGKKQGKKQVKEQSDSLERVYFSFLCSVLLRDCPFYTIKSFFLKDIKSFCEDESKNFAAFPNFINPLSDMRNIIREEAGEEFFTRFQKIYDTINLLNELYNTLYKCLIYTYGKDSSLEEASISKLIRLLWDQVTDTRQFSWSKLECLKKPDDYHLHSLLDRYIDFYTLRCFFDIDPKNAISNITYHFFQDEYMQYLRTARKF